MEMARADICVAASLRLFLSPILTGMAYYLAAIVSLSLTRGTAGLAMLWPSSGILFAVLLVTPRHRITWHVAAAAIGSLAANLHAGTVLATSIGFTVANMGESLSAAWLLRARSRCRVSFVDPGSLTRFCMAALLATVLAATIAVIVSVVPSIGFWFSWFTTDLLGILIVTPLILIAERVIRGGSVRLTRKAVIDATFMFALVTVVTGLTFSQSSYPLLFVPMLAVLAATFRLGPLGAAGGVLIVTGISTVAIGTGSGPHVLVHAGPLARSLFMQFYLLALFASALPIATLLAARSRLTEQVAEKMRLLQLAESAAHVGHWRLDTATGTITWSREVFRIHGIDGEVPPALDAAIEAYHLEDRPLVSERLEEAIRDNHGFAFTARIIRPDGEVRHVFSRGEIDGNADDGAPALFGIIQDITAQVAHEAALEEARRHAEDAAAKATIMAETDQLTGIANRRRTSFALDQAVQVSRDTGRSVAVAMFDIDHFKRINDTYGHQAGDEVLKRVAADAGKELRSADTLGRFGGEEFVIVLPDATASVAMMVAERVRLAIEAGGDNPRVTISVGVAELATGESCESLLKRADQALYAAKREGRNALRLAA
ncbi:sensor domain-containing diguanylate cyclase [Sphingomonas sp. MA1305]|jgi:diguanylate cyclase (GGDEF)-like protein|uniref:sensor domain-containing diguanylate cyclase n=1 Tax=unclassified Sphingomonas TaxID=196159 RepID=UPI0018E0340E|nr:MULTISPECIES: sensor domain-containing diguanylate cyclase [unclassified Sphingomonas]MBI0477013.1 sensor domain-containing diguanylate cyclase [Sphingomonas sp. MA1305]MCP4025487.1 diguanylate cyclase [Sphingomonas sp.]